VTFFKRLQFIRKYYKINQTELGEVFGVSQTGYSKIERGGVARINPEKLTEFIHRHNINPLFLFGFTDSLSEIEIQKQDTTEIPPPDVNIVHDCVREHPDFLVLLDKICKLNEENFGLMITNIRLLLAGLDDREARRKALGE